MKMRYILMAMPVFLLGLSACDNKKKDEGKTTTAGTTQQGGGDEGEVPAPPATAPVVLTPAERAEVLGFSQYLPQETEVVFARFNGSENADRFTASKFWKAMGNEPMDPIDDGVEEIVGPADLFEQEFTLGFGKGTADQSSNLIQLKNRLFYTVSKALVGEYSRMEKSGESMDIFELLEDIVIELAKDPQSGMALYENMNMPPVYVAFHTTEENREAAEQQLAQTLAEFEFDEKLCLPVETEMNGTTFKGFQVDGSKVAEIMKSEKEELVRILSEAVADRFIEATSKKNLYVVTGTIGEYVTMFIGSSAEEFRLAASVDESLLATSAMSFCDAYADKELTEISYVQGAALNQMISSKSLLADIADGARDGLSATDAFGDTRNLETLLGMIKERESAWFDLHEATGSGSVTYFEEGIKIETFGGFDYGAFDWEASNQMASLGDRDGVVMFANYTSDAVYDEKMRNYLEAVLETSYVAAMKFAELPDEGGDMMELKNYSQLFDAKFRPYLLTFWEGFSGGFNGAIGYERAWVMDLDGSVPTLPNIPQAVVDEGRFPRISMLAPVTDRSKLGESWVKMNEGMTGIMGSVSGMMGSEIPMQKPISSEKDGYTTWFYGMPFFNDDFMPSVTVGDKWFSASSSKAQSLDLIDAAEAGGPTQKGVYFSLDIKAVDAYMEDMLVVVSKHQEELGMSDGDLKQMEVATKMLDDMDDLTIHVRREEGQLRSSIYLKTR